MVLNGKLLALKCIFPIESDPLAATSFCLLAFVVPLKLFWQDFKKHPIIDFSFFSPTMLFYIPPAFASSLFEKSELCSSCRCIKKIIVPSCFLSFHLVWSNKKSEESRKGRKGKNPAKLLVFRSATYKKRPGYTMEGFIPPLLESLCMDETVQCSINICSSLLDKV